MTPASEITMELMTDIATALRNVARDVLPNVGLTVTTITEPPGVVLRVPGATTVPMQEVLKELAQSTKYMTDKTFPSLPLRYLVVGGSEAAGIEISMEPGAKPVYGHVIRAKVDRLMVSAALKDKPQLVAEVLRDLGGG